MSGKVQFAGKAGYIGLMRKIVLHSLMLFAAIVFMAFPALAQPGRSAWDEADFSRVRVLMTPTTVDGTVDGGVEIQLEPGWHTYWRVPGDAGVPPQFDFSRSENVAEVEVHYPVPERYDDGASVSVVYNDRVVFPLTVRPEDARKPVTLALDIFYGACAEVCIPVKATAETSLDPDDKADPLARVAIAEFRNRLPAAPSAGFSITSVSRDDEALTITARIPDGDKADLFSAGPADWFTGQPELVERGDKGATFRFSLKGVPEGAEIDGAFDFLLVAGQRGVIVEKAVITAAE